MPINTDPQYVGKASISPAGPVVAGQLGTWTITYEVGAYGYDEFARLKIASRFASDWGTPQFTDAKGANYTTVRLESRCPTTVAHLAWEPRGYVRPWFKCLVVSIRDGSLYPGDRIHVTIGDRSGGGPGSRAQTFRERGCELRLLVDPFGTELYSALVPSPQLDVVGGSLHRLVVVAPTTVLPGESFEALVKAEDVWGNPCERFEGVVTLAVEGAPLDGLPRELSFRQGALAVATVGGLRAASSGAETRIVAAHGQHRAESNLIRALSPGEPKTWWGDLHGQTRATVGTGTIEEYFAFGREVALLDMMCHQANDFQVTDEEWRPLRDLRRLRVVRHDAGRGRSQRHVPRRRRRAPPLVARRGRRHARRRDRLLSGHRSLRAARGPGRRHADPAHRGSLRRHRGLPRSRARAGRRDLLGLGALRMAPRGRDPAGLQGRRRRELGRAQGPTRRQPSRRLDIRRLWRPHLRAGRIADARSRVRRDQGPPLLWRHRGAADPHRARRERSADGRRRTHGRSGHGARPRRRHRADRARGHLQGARAYKDALAL